MRSICGGCGKATHSGRSCSPGPRQLTLQLVLEHAEARAAVAPLVVYLVDVALLARRPRAPGGCHIQMSSGRWDGQDCARRASASSRISASAESMVATRRRSPQRRRSSGSTAGTYVSGLMAVGMPLGAPAFEDTNLQQKPEEVQY